MPPSEIRKEAREALSGKWGKAISIILIYLALSFLVGLLEGLCKKSMPILYNIIDIVYSIISIPIGFGLIISFMKLKRNETISVFSFLKDGFVRFGKAFGVCLYTILKMLLPCICLFLVFILLIVLTIFNIHFNGNALVIVLLTLFSVSLYIATLVYVASRGFLYVIAFHIAYDNPDLSSKDCVLKSETFMKGNRGNYFLLELSFIGWIILTGFSLGIGLLWLVPYMAMSTVCFYEKVSKTKSKQLDGNTKLVEE